MSLHQDNFAPALENAIYTWTFNNIIKMKKTITCLIYTMLSASSILAQPAHHSDKPSELHGKGSIVAALKTNILYDLISTPNISGELYLRNNWTAGLGYWYTWWHTDPLHKYWRTYGGEIFTRKYFGAMSSQQPFSGHHIGLISQMGMYDFEFGNTGYMSDFSYSIGTEYGYSFPLGKRINLDISAAFGYIGGKYKVYKPIDTHYVWQETRNRRWIGPIKAEVSIAFMLGSSNANVKGGNK